MQQEGIQEELDEKQAKLASLREQQQASQAQQQASQALLHENNTHQEEGRRWADTAQAHAQQLRLQEQAAQEPEQLHHALHEASSKTRPTREERAALRQGRYDQEEIDQEKEDAEMATALTLSQEPRNGGAGDAHSHAYSQQQLMREAEKREAERRDQEERSAGEFSLTAEWTAHEAELKRQREEGHRQQQAAQQQQRQQQILAQQAAENERQHEQQRARAREHMQQLELSEQQQQQQKQQELEQTQLAHQQQLQQQQHQQQLQQLQQQQLEEQQRFQAKQEALAQTQHNHLALAGSIGSDSDKYRLRREQQQLAEMHSYAQQSTTDDAGMDGVEVVRGEATHQLVEAAVDTVAAWEAESKAAGENKGKGDTGQQRTEADEGRSKRGQRRLNREARQSERQAVEDDWDQKMLDLKEEKQMATALTGIPSGRAGGGGGLQQGPRALQAGRSGR